MCETSILVFLVRASINRPFNVVQIKSYCSPELLTYELDITFEPFKLPTDDLILLTEVLDPDDPRAMSCTEGEDSQSPSGRAPHVRGRGE